MPTFANGLEKKLEYGGLAAFYGPLLTSRQRQMVGLYCDEDLSLGEIAAQQGVSRQGVADTLRKAFTKLADLERQLALRSRFARVASQAQACRQLLVQTRVDGAAAQAIRQAVGMLDDLLAEEEQ